MAYTKCPICGTESNTQNQPLFVLTTNIQRAIDDGPLTKKMCWNIIESVESSDQWPDFWQNTWRDVFTSEEKEHIRHVQILLPNQSPARSAFELINCFTTQA